MEHSKKLVNILYVVTKFFFILMGIAGAVAIIGLVATLFIDITIPDFAPDMVTLGQTISIETSTLVGKDINALVSIGLLTATLSLSFLTYFVYSLNIILKNVKKDEVFISRNSIILKRLGYSLVVWSVISSLLQSFMARAFVKVIEVNFGGIESNFSLDLQTLFFGLILLLLAEIFTYGSHLKNEYDATV